MITLEKEGENCPLSLCGVKGAGGKWVLLPCPALWQLGEQRLKEEAHCFLMGLPLKVTF